MPCGNCPNVVLGLSGDRYCSELMEPCDEVGFCPYDPPTDEEED